MITKLIDKFDGRLTRDNIGDMNSGMVKYTTSFGYDPFTNPGNLTWMEQPVQIDPTASVITDLIMAMAERIENGIVYVYAIGHTGRLYKIQVSITNNPDYDHAVLVATLTGGLTFKYGASVQFFGATEKIFIGHDTGVTKIAFDGSGQVNLTTATTGTVTTTVPRPSANFLGSLYFGNGSNILQIDSTELIIQGQKLSPGFPSGTYVRDLDVSPDGNYLQIIVFRVNSVDLTQLTVDTSSLAAGDSYKFMWNGTDTGYTSYQNYKGYSTNSNTVFGSYSYLLGYDLSGAAIYSGGSKLEALPKVLSPNFGSMFSTGNMLGFATPENNGGVLKGSIFFYGRFDEQATKGLFRVLRVGPLASGSETDIIQVPVCLPVSNLFYGSSQSGYANQVIGTSKVYFSTLEISGSTTAYRFYRFSTYPIGNDSPQNGIYETQQETSVKLFRNILKKKLKVYEVRVFTPPLAAGIQFKIDLIGNDGNPIANASQTFTPATGAVLMKYNPQMAPSYSIGVRITNQLGSRWVCEKIEVDIDEVNA